MKVEVGDTRTLQVVDDLTRTQIVQYAGASGDYNPLHSDDKFTTEVAGYPSVFAHGMLTMGMTGRVLTDWTAPPLALNLVTPAGGPRPVRTRVLVDFLAQRFAAGAAPWTVASLTA